MTKNYVFLFVLNRASHRPVIRTASAPRPMDTTSKVESIISLAKTKMKQFISLTKSPAAIVAKKIIVKNTRPTVLRDPARIPIYGNGKNIRAPIDFVIIYKNGRNANKWIFDERGRGGRGSMGEPKSAYTANRCAAVERGGGERRGERERHTKAGGKPNHRCTYMHPASVHIRSVPEVSSRPFASYA